MLRKTNNNQSKIFEIQINLISTTIDLSTITNSYNRFCSIKLYKKNLHQVLAKTIKRQCIIFLK